MKKIPIGVSSCLFDQLANSGAIPKKDAVINEAACHFFEFFPFAVSEEAELTVFPTTHSEALIRPGSDLGEGTQLCGYIIKKKNLASASEVAKNFGNPSNGKDSIGLEALKIMRNFPLLPVEEDVRLENACFRDNFFKRIHVVYRWQMLKKEGLTAHGLIEFHARHKLIIMSHADYRDLGQLLAGLTKENLAEVANQYILQLMNTLLTVPSRANHVNVLQHIQGYLKKELGRDDKAELCELIESYRNCEVPLIAPITLLKHHFRKCPDPYIQSSYYFSPYPSALGEVNP
ncbi:MAG: DUF1722 domain-containing protein [Methylicorpusculum sp.]|uniref:YbgA family protein n=1 Tax=Methylicorpusculum sp. TaxID=2713644 RepID=UPI00272672F7|nr:DUF1722 domain-containing protein [Methylicorpusculum sp.]MDO8845022.1 DUF1722 domain-containing protein [Methylicorpusculum sp.]MDO8940000.1 DUF1722 domain-containing protein [Methylicorpusculum sp.]MDO9240549.1 DUF1722 domain-containing protein [Methylicorpusculum sp.]MDP2203128.1 DUF1722 domain-containing protein [Methylicorpusculum sp.]